MKREEIFKIQNIAIDNSLEICKCDESNIEGIEYGDMYLSNKGEVEHVVEISLTEGDINHVTFFFDRNFNLVKYECD